jgi:B12-binding domain/radical SAM domain protein
MRDSKKAKYTIAALSALVDFELVHEPQRDVTMYSFCTPEKNRIYSEVEKKKEDGIVFIAGGPHASGAPREVLRYFDIALIGEAEMSLPLLLEKLRKRESIKDVPGIAYREGEKIIINPPPTPIDLNEFSKPYKFKAPVEIARGCPHGCKYCQTPGIFGRKMRFRAPENVVKMVKRYKEIRFISPDSFRYGGEKREEWIKKLFKVLEGKKIYFGTFPSEVRPDSVSEDILSLISEHCENRSIHIGAQSGSERVLKEIARGHGVSEVYEACEMILSNGLKPIVDVIFGLPCEKEEDQLLTLDMVKEIVKMGGEIRSHYFFPLPGTPYEKDRPSEISEEVKKIMGKLALKGYVRGIWDARTKG